MTKLPVSRWTAGWLFGIACTGLLGAYFGSRYVEGTDAFRSALVGAVVGGAFTLLGGLAGAVYVGAKDDERQKERDERDLVGAVREVRNELAGVVAATRAFLEFRDDHGAAAAASILSEVANRPELAAPRYGAHSFRLARDLKPSAWQAVDDAYTRAAFLRQTVVFALAEAPAISEGTLAVFAETRDLAQAAVDALKPFSEPQGGA